MIFNSKGAAGEVIQRVYSNAELNKVYGIGGTCERGKCKIGKHETDKGNKGKFERFQHEM